MDLSTMIAAVRNNLNETGITEMFSDDNITEWLNAGVTAASLVLPPQLLPSLQKKSTGNGTTLALPADYLRPVALTLGSRKVPIIDPSAPGYDPGETDAAFDHYGLLWGSSVEFHPATAVDYSLFYISKPSDMTTGTDVPDIPDAYHYAVVCYATYLGASKDRMLRTQYLEMYHELIFGRNISEGGGSQ